MKDKDILTRSQKNGWIQDVYIEAALTIIGKGHLCVESPWKTQ